MDSLSLYMLTFNCARTPVDIDLFASHFFDALPHTDTLGDESFTPPELIVLCLQEIAPIAYAFLGGSYLDTYFNSFRRVIDQAVSKRWDGTSYDILVRDNSGMTGLLVFARSDVVDKVSWIDSARVGFGFQQMGNKGAVGARLGYSADRQSGNTVDLTFVAAHLAPMEWAWEQRNRDWRSIVERLVFSREQDAKRRNVEAGGDSEESAGLLQGSSAERHGKDGGVFVPTTYLFLGGDLNYRTSNTSPLKGDHIRFPRFNADPSSPQHYSQLLKDDQLTREMRKARSFQGMSEAPITFPPTYKYTSAARKSAREALYSGESKLQEQIWTSSRWPSWCDRILYLDTPSWMKGARKVQPHKYDALPLFPTSDHRPVALSVSVPLDAIQVPRDIDDTNDVRLAAPFAVDPEWESKRDAARTKELLVGYLAYIGWTWEGNGYLLATILGLFGVWLVLGSMIYS
jgi:hypothetical protein